MDRCLFLDDWHIASMEGLERRPHAAERYEGNPVTVKEFPWEQSRLQLYGRCIVYNEERKRGILKGCVNSQAVYPLSEQDGLKAQERRYTAYGKEKH